MLFDSTVSADAFFEKAESYARAAEFAASKDEVKWKEQLARSLGSLIAGCSQLSSAISRTNNLLEKINKRLDSLARERRKF